MTGESQMVSVSVGKQWLIYWYVKPIYFFKILGGIICQITGTQNFYVQKYYIGNCTEM